MVETDRERIEHRRKLIKEALDDVEKTIALLKETARKYRRALWDMNREEALQELRKHDDML